MFNFAQFAYFVINDFKSIKVVLGVKYLVVTSTIWASICWTSLCSILLNLHTYFVTNGFKSIKVVLGVT